MAIMSSETDMSTEKQTLETRQAVMVKIAIVLSVLALIVSGVSLGGWAQAVGERQQIETRLACLELPGPNDCGQDGR